MAKKLAQIIIDDTQARLLFVDKEELNKLYIFYLSKNKFTQEEVIIKAAKF